MLIKVKNKDTLIFDDFTFRCVVGKEGITSNKREGDLRTPKGLFKLYTVYYRADRIKNIQTKLKLRKIKKNMGWCNDPRDKKYNSLVNINEKIKHEKLYRKDNKYDVLIVIDYNLKRPIPFKGSAIFIHLTKNFKGTAGCVALLKKDLLIILKLINRKTKIKIN
jgi:L,D-peptidoglycan transpeptidase YkuD (ErfK/YbiS/YcfS/YnhG family)